MIWQVSLKEIQFNPDRKYLMGIVNEYLALEDQIHKKVSCWI